MARRTNKLSEKELLPQRPSIPGIDDFDSALHMFIRDCKIRNLSEHTTKYYRSELVRFRKTLESQGITSNPREIKRQHIRENLIAYSIDKGLKETSINTRIRAVKAFFNFLERESYILENPTEDVKLLKEKRTIIETFTREQILALLRQPDQKTFTGIRDYSILILLLETGVRARELCDIKVDDIKWQDNVIKIDGKGYKQRHVPIQTTVKRQLAKYVQIRGDIETEILFVNIDNKPLSKRRIQELCAEYGRKAGINNVRCSPHTFRHTFAKLSVKNGANVFDLQSVLGHTSLEMVRRYVNMFSDDIYESHKKFSPIEKLF